MSTASLGTLESTWVYCTSCIANTVTPHDLALELDNEVACKVVQTG